MTAPVIPTIPANAPPHERPDFKHPAYVETEKARRVSRALMQGTEGVRALGPEALPKWPAEEPGFYRLRARIARLTRYYERTVEAVVGMIVASPPTFAEGPDARILADWEDIDRKGTHGDVFVRELTQEAIVGGFAAILVDAPPVPEGVTLTLANQQRGSGRTGSCCGPSSSSRGSSRRRIWGASSRTGHAGCSPRMRSPDSPRTRCCGRW